MKAENNVICEICGKEYHVKPSHIKRYKHHTCSKECCNKLKSILYKGSGNHQWGLKGDKNASFKGKRTLKRNNGVTDILVYMPNHPYANKDGRITLHRLTVENNYNKFNIKYFEEVNGKIVLRKDSHVHHINGNHDDNNIENLIPVTKSEHRAIHNSEVDIKRDLKTGRIIGVVKRGELLENPEVDNQQPSLNGDVLEGSETNSRVLRDSNADTSALHYQDEDIVRSA